jgi:hypothetical protein
VYGYRSVFLLVVPVEGRKNTPLGRCAAKLEHDNNR